MLASRVLRLRQSHLSVRVRGRLTYLGLGPISSLHLQPARHAKSRLAFPPGEAASEDDYTDTPNYPPIDPETVRFTEARRQRLQGVLNWQQGMLKKETLEEKLMELNIMRRYGWFVFGLSDQLKSYDDWELIKYVTRTHLMEPVQIKVEVPGADPGTRLVTQHLPDIYYSPELNEKVAHFKNKLQANLHEVIKFEMDGVERVHNEDDFPADIEHRRTTSIVNQISRFLIQELSTEVDYLRAAQMDRNPKIEAFWIMGGFSRNDLQKKSLRNLGKLKKAFLTVKEDDPIERNMQYDGSNIVQLRTEFPFSPFVDQDIKLESESEPPSRFPYSPKAYTYKSTVRYATQNAGHWSGCQSRSNLLSIHSTHHLLGVGNATSIDYHERTNNQAWLAKQPELLKAQAAIASFAKLMAQANTLGFNQWCDVPHPLASQTILTNGDNWSFHTYQLNTFKFDGRNIAKNKRTNVMWGTPTMKLIKEDGTLNSDVVEHLLKFYLAPSLMDTDARFDTPHIKKNLNEMDDEERRNFIFYNFQTMVSQRNYDDPLKQLPEIYQWEKFYKVDHQKRIQDARRRFFELPEQMGPPPYKQPYRLINPNLVKSKRLRAMYKELEEKKEAARVKESYAAAKNRFKDRGTEDADNDNEDGSSDRGDK